MTPTTPNPLTPPASTRTVSLIQFARIESPCPRAGGDWGHTERERFCDLCNLSVHNLSARTFGEANELLTATRGRLCIRYEHDGAGRPLTIEQRASLNRFRRLAAPIAGAAARVAAFIGLAALAAALGSLSGCSTGGSRLNLNPKATGELGGALRERIPDGAEVYNSPSRLNAVLDEAIRSRQSTSPHIWSAPDE